MSDYITFIKGVLEEIAPYDEFDEDTELIESALLDSLTIVFLVTQIEEKYNITIDEKFITPENFTSINRIAALLKQIGNC